MRVRIIQAPQLGDNGEFVKYKKLFLPYLSLPTLAGLTPPDIDLRITQGFVDDIDFDEDVDLVAVTSQTSQASGAYKIAHEFRKRGIQTIIGGIHASMCPDEAQEHFDAVAVGEAENIWKDILRDAEKKRLKKRYQSNEYTEFTTHTLPRFDLLNYDNYIIPPFARTPLIPVMATRGCPNKCDFCVTPQFMGRKLRKKPIDFIIKEIEHTDPSRFFFVDDNLFSDYRYACDLMKALIPLKKRWSCQMSTTISRHPDLIQLAAEAGCHENYMGIETTDPANLKDINKNFNKIDEYKNLFRILKQVGILVQASIIFGFDNDTIDSLRRTIDTVLEWDINYLFIYILTPFPGTKLREDLEKAGRIIDSNWTHYDGTHVLYQPKKISIQELNDVYWKAYSRFYGMKPIVKRFLNFGKEYIKFFPRDLFYEELFFSINLWHIIKKGKHPFSLGIKIKK